MHGAERQTAERQLRALLVRAQLLLEAAQRVTTQNQLRRSIRGEDQQRTCVGPAREIREHVERRRVAPVQILEDEDERLLRREPLDRSAEEPDRALRHHPARGRAACARSEDGLGETAG